MANLDPFVVDIIEGAIDSKVSVPNTASRTVSATITQIDSDGTVWATPQGLENEVPVDILNTEVEPGDNVDISVSGGRATTIGNRTAPATTSRAVQLVTSSIRNEAEAAKEAAEATEQAVKELRTITSATNQHFWTRTQSPEGAGAGAFVTDMSKNDWLAGAATDFPDISDEKSYANILLNSYGGVIRSGITPHVSISRSATAFYDGNGGSGNNVSALFGKDMLRIGKLDEVNTQVSNDGWRVLNGRDLVISAGGARTGETITLHSLGTATMDWDRKTIAAAVQYAHDHGQEDELHVDPIASVAIFFEFSVFEPTPELWVRSGQSTMHAGEWLPIEDAMADWESEFEEPVVEYRRTAMDPMQDGTRRDYIEFGFINSYEFELEIDVRTVYRPILPYLNMYDGGGNDASNIMASFGGDRIRIGYEDETHTVLSSSGMTVREGDSIVASIERSTHPETVFISGNALQDGGETSIATGEPTCSWPCNFDSVYSLSSNYVNVGSYSILLENADGSEAVAYDGSNVTNWASWANDILSIRLGSAAEVRDINRMVESGWKVVSATVSDGRYNSPLTKGMVNVNGEKVSEVVFTTDDGDSSFYSWIRAYLVKHGTSSYRHNVFWRSGGNLTIGAGLFADSAYNTNIGLGTKKNLNLGADEDVLIYTNTGNLSPLDQSYKQWRFNRYGNLVARQTRQGIFGVDGSGFVYPYIWDNGTNLWIGATQTKAQHHKGGTYISSGHDGSAGMPTVYVSVPNAANDNATNYGVYHTGNKPSLGDLSGKVAAANIGSLPASKIGSGTLDVARIPNISVDKLTGTLPIGKGGTGQTTANAAARALGMAKTAGDTINLNGYWVVGLLTGSRKSIRLSISLPFRFFGVTSCSVSGTAYVRQGDYLWGSSSSAAVNINSSPRSSEATAYANGFINITLSNTVEQTSATNNAPISVYFPTLTVTLS